MTSREAEIQARLDAATPGPWEVYDPGDGTARLWTVRDNEDDAERLIHEPIGYLDWDNGELIANAPADLAYLLARVATLEAQVAAVRGALPDSDEPVNPYMYDPWDDDSVDPTNLDDVVSAAVNRGWDSGAWGVSQKVRGALDSAGGGE